MESVAILPDGPEKAGNIARHLSAINVSKSLQEQLEMSKPGNGIPQRSEITVNSEDMIYFILKPNRKTLRHYFHFRSSID